MASLRLAFVMQHPPKIAKNDRCYRLPRFAESAKGEGFSDFPNHRCLSGLIWRCSGFGIAIAGALFGS